MPKAFLESNVINWARRDGVSGRDLRAILAERSFEPFVGMHGIYELARAFLNPQSRLDGVANFEIIVDLEPTYSPPVGTLISKEVDKLRTGAEVIPVLEPLDHTSAKYEVLRLSQGIVDEHAESFIRDREQEIEEVHPAQMEQYRDIVRRELEERPPEAPKLRTFADVVHESQGHVSELISKSVTTSLTSEECHRIQLTIGEFPTIRTLVRANLYLSSIPILHDDVPADDKLDDYRHVIEASYADLFVTGDEQLARTAPRLNPDLQVLRWSELFAETTSAG